MKLADFVEDFRSQKKKKNSYYRRSEYMPTISEVRSRMDHYESLGDGLLDYQKAAVNWILDGKVRLIADHMGIHCYREVIFCLPSKKAGTIIVYSKDDLPDWTVELDRYRPDLDYKIASSAKTFEFPKPGEVTIVTWDKLPPPSVFEQKISPFVLVLGDVHFAKNPKTRRRKRIEPFVERSRTLIAQTFDLNLQNPADYYEILELMRINPFDMSLSTFTSRYWEEDKNKDKDAYDRFTSKIELEEFAQTFMMQRDPRYTTVEFPPIRRTENFITPKNDEIEHLDAKRDQKYISGLKLPYVQDLADSYRFYECKTIVLSRYPEILDRISARRLKSDEDLRKEPVFTATHREFMGLYLRIIDTPGKSGPLTIVRVDLDISEEVNEYNMSRIKSLASRRCKNGSIQFIDIKDIKIDHPIDKEMWG